jgi:hypothetical protein
MDKKHLNKIVEYLLEDTIIHYDNYQSIQLIGSDTEYEIESLSDSEFFNMMFDKLEKDYGLNSDDCLYVYGNYLYQIHNKIKLHGSINESVDSKEIYLDKIVDYMVEDTTMTPKEILFPFMTKPYLRSPYGRPERFPFHFFYEVFTQYCSDNYGLTENESYSVWEKYKTILIGNKLINESVDSKKIYLDKIVQYIIDDTIIDYEEREIKYPYFSNILLLTPNKQQHLPVHSFRAFSIYCENMYGLNIEEIQYVWHHYIKNSELF